MINLSYTSRPVYNETFSGVPENYLEINTLYDLLKVNYKYLGIERQMRENLIRLLKQQINPYLGIIGYDDDVIPAINRAILSGHDFVLVGQIGQAKTKIAETISSSLLSPIPIVSGTNTNDIPTEIPAKHLISLLEDKDVGRISPEFVVSKECEEIIRNNGLDTRIEWIDGHKRYRYILATPDISVKDLVGQVDAIKIAKKGFEIYDIGTYSPGQLLQARHGILCIDELPVLDTRKQVSLLSVLQEGKFTTGTYPVYFKPDVKIIATANPIDYTHSGKIIEPLFDRLKSHINTHYPFNVYDEMIIMIQEAKIYSPANVIIPYFILKALSNVTHLARNSSEVNKDKGVSVRMSVHGLEVIVSEAERTRSIKYNIKTIPRFSDLFSIYQTSKFELSDLDDTSEDRLKFLNLIIEKTIKDISLEYVKKIPTNILSLIKEEFAREKTFFVSQSMPGLFTSTAHNSQTVLDYSIQLSNYPSLKIAIENIINPILKQETNILTMTIKNLNIKLNGLNFYLDNNNEFYASVVELILEGLRNIEKPIITKKDINTYESISEHIHE